MKFLNPYFLWALLAVAVPIVIHLFNFRRFKKVYFTNVAMLRQSEIVTKKQNRIKQLLLLAIRCLAVIFLSLLFAQPYFDNGNNALNNQGQNSVIVFLDNSFSMENNGQSGRLLDDAKAKAKQIVEQFSDNDAFMLLTMDLEGRHKHFVNRKQFLSLLGEINITPATMKFSEVVKQCQPLLDLRNDNKRLFIISDFQKSEFDIDNLTSQKEISPAYLLPLSANNTDNVYVDSVWFASDFIQKGQNVEITARITNWGEEKVEKIPLKLFINNIQTAITAIDLDPKKSQNISMNFKPESSGLIQGKISLLDNPVTFDDDFYFALNLKDKFNVCIINGEEPNPYLQRLFSSTEEVNLVNMSEKAINYSDLPKYSTIILNALKQITSGLTSELQRFCEDGGTAVIIPNSRIELSSYQSAMKNLRIATYKSLIERENRVSVINDKAKLYRGVFSAMVDNMEMPKVNGYFSFESNNSAYNESLMTMQNSDDFLCVSQIGKGRIYVFAADLKEKNTDFVSQALFVPTLWNMIFYTSPILPYYSLADNSLIDITAFRQSTNEVLKIENQNANASIIAQVLRNANRTSIMLNHQLKTSGCYNIVADSAFAVIALNYDRNESKLEFLTSSQIQTLLKKQNIKEISVFNPSKDLMAYFKQGTTGFNLSFILICLILMCLSVEIFLLFRRNPHRN